MEQHKVIDCAIDTLEAAVFKIRQLRQDKAELLKALRKIDALLSDNDAYKGIWANYPTKPEVSPKDIVKAAIAPANPHSHT